MTTYNDLGLGHIVEGLTRGRIEKDRLCHPDPDLEAGALGVSGAQAHLRSQAVRPGDLFLFWGLYREAQATCGTYQFIRSARKEHWLFGWLQIGDIIALGEDGTWIVRQRPELARHPHCRPGWPARNTLYVASDRLRFGGRKLNVPGAGMFTKADPRLRLTAESAITSLWQVPLWLRRTGLSYHSDPKRWGRGTLQVVGRGQEFVTDIGDDAEAISWLGSLFDESLCAPLQHSKPARRASKSAPLKTTPRIWRYVVTTDGGHAPCVYRGMLSLCICKPVIRHGAKVGDWVVGFMPKKFGPRVVWAGRVSGKMPMGRYCERYPRRPDAIYDLAGLEPDGSERLRHKGGPIHNDSKAQETDRRGKYALIFREFWYWGGDAPAVPGPIERLAYYRQGQTTRHAGATEDAQLTKWLSRWEPGVHGRPRNTKRRC